MQPHGPLPDRPGRAQRARAERAVTGRYFEYMLTRFTEPSEIIGPIDINQLRDGRYIRREQGRGTFVTATRGSGAPARPTVAVVNNVEADHLECYGTLAELEAAFAAYAARAAQVLAGDKNVTAVACFTMQGQTAWLMSKIRPRVPIMAFTPDQGTYQRLAFLWGVSPHKVEFVNSLEEMLDHVDAALMRSDVVHMGDQVVLVCGFPVGAIRPPNMALLHTVGEN